MSRTAFFIECSAPHWVDVARNLRTNGIEVTYWSAWHLSKTEINAVCPSAIFHDTAQAKVAIAATDFSEVAAFDQACQAVWEKEAQVIYDMMNRFDHSRDQSLVERSTLFFNHLIYWRAALDRLKPDIIVFPAPPHVVYDYIILCLCRELGISTVMFEEATVYPPYCLAMRDYREGSIELRAAASVQHRVSALSKNIALKLRGAYADAKPYREVEAHRIMESALNEGARGAQKWAAAIKKTDANHRGRYSVNEKIVNVTSIYKEKGKTLRDSFQGPFANSRYADQILQDRSITDELRAFYHSNSISTQQLRRPFAYFPLAGQPERTSNPQAGIYTNQLLIASQIRNLLPILGLEDLVIKEHPNQFHPLFAVNMCRDRGFYEEMLRVGAKFAPTNTDPFWLIDNAAVVITTGGTTALEAVARGKPVLLYGDAWYRDCPGVLRVRSHADVKAAAYAIKSGEIALSPEAFENYLEAITKGCFQGLGDYPPENYPMDNVENVENLTRIVIAALDGQPLLKPRCEAPPWPGEPA